MSCDEIENCLSGLYCMKHIYEHTMYCFSGRGPLPWSRCEACRGIHSHDSPISSIHAASGRECSGVNYSTYHLPCRDQPGATFPIVPNSTKVATPGGEQGEHCDFT